MRLRLYALLLSLVAAGLVGAGWWELRIRRDLAAQMTRLSRQNADLRYELKQVTQQVETLEQRAVALDNQLGSAKTRTTATESKHILLARELHETKTLLTEREQREVALMTELATLREMLAAASPPAADASPSELRIAELERQLTGLLTRALAEPVEPSATPPPPPAPPQVVRVGPA